MNNDTSDEFDYFHDILLTFNSHISDKKMLMDSMEHNVYEFFGKLYTQYITFSSLKNGSLYHTKNGVYKVEDVTSIIVLLRSMLETLLMFFYIFCDTKDNEELHFRFNCWKHQGILTRYNLAKDIQKYCEGGKKSDEDRITNLRSKIKKSKYWSTIENHKKFEQYGTFCPSWNSMLKRMSANKLFENELYSYFSSFSHSEYLNLSQLSLLRIENKTENTARAFRKLLFPIYSTFLLLLLEVMGEGIDLKKDQHDYLFACSDFLINSKEMLKRIRKEN